MGYIHISPSTHFLLSVIMEYIHKCTIADYITICPFHQLISEYRLKRKADNDMIMKAKIQYFIKEEEVKNESFNLEFMNPTDMPTCIRDSFRRQIMSLYSVVIPVYNSEHTLEELYKRLKNVFDETLKEDFELILVDDGSKDQSYAIMQNLRSADKRVKIIQMAKNFGQHPALLCGFSFAKGDFVITMDDDLQHPPEEIPKMTAVMNQRDDVDVIIAKYEGRQHGFIRRLGTKFSVYATSKMLRKDPELEITSFRLIRKFIVDALLKTNTHLPQIGNLLVQTSNRIINVPVRHDARTYGKSGYPFIRLVKDLIFDITNHSAFPLLVVRDIGFAGFILSILLALYFLVRFFLYGASVEGWTSLMLIILAGFSLTLLSLGVIGMYLMNILNESKKMPHYTIRKKDLS